MTPANRTRRDGGQRNNLSYLLKWGGGRKLHAIIVIVIFVFSVLWLLSSAPLSSVHSFTGRHCETCHASVVEARFMKLGFKKLVSDQACVSCHQAPAHHAAEQIFAPACASCHVEHQGAPYLRQPADKKCSQCHGNLKVKSGQPHYQSGISGFDITHPEFAALRDGYTDPGTIKINHAVHMKAGLLGPDSRPVQMECPDCHRTAAEQAGRWKYGQAKDAQIAFDTAYGVRSGMLPEPVQPGSGRAYMVAPTYSSACQNCHSLQFDALFSESAPHDKPQVVHAFIVRKLTEYIQRHSWAVREPARPLRRIFSGAISNEPQEPVIAHDASEWVRLRSAADEKLLWRKTCVQCHTVKYTRTDQNSLPGLPEIAPSDIKPIWLPHSVFSHYSHSGIDCKSCHTKAAKSQDASDVLIPGIRICQRCHNGDPAANGGTQNGCFLCHHYHNWKQPDQPPRPTYTIEELRGVARAHPSGPFGSLGPAIAVQQFEIPEIGTILKQKF
jgi:ssDNA-binding Zn-finger/Zn-ribbon topoisomerase 1